MIRLMITLEGGLVNWVGCDTVLPMEVLIVDYDTDDADPDDQKLYEIPQSTEGETATAYARIETVDASDPQFIANAFEAMDTCAMCDAKPLPGGSLCAECEADSEGEEP